MQIGEAPQGEAEGHQEVLISPLFPAETVEQLAQRCHRLRRWIRAAQGCGRVSTGWLAAHGMATAGVAK